MSEQHLLTYYTWKTRRSWRLDGLARAAGGSPEMRYIFRRVGAWEKYAKPGNVLWVLGLSAEGRPTLDACIQIDKNYFRRRKNRSTGEVRPWRGVCGTTRRSSLPANRPASRYFGLNDAEEAMARVAFLNAKGKTWRLRPTEPATSWRSQHGGRLQNPLRLAPLHHELTDGGVSPGAAPLEKLAATCERRSLFISYKHLDFADRRSRRFLDRLATELSRRGICVWLDRVALGNSAGAELPRESARELGQLLSQGLDQSRVVLGLWSPRYGTPSTIDGRNWTRQEWRGQRLRIALDPSRRYRTRRGLARPAERVLLPADPRPRDARAVAERVVRKCRGLWS